MSDSEEYDSDSSSYSETTSDDEFPEDFGYWDPISDTYRSKRTNRVIPEEKVPDAYDPDEYDTDPSIKSKTASDTGPLSDMEYWDPTDDVYRNKRTNECVPERITLEMSDSEEYDSDSSSYSETTSDDEYPEDFGYWDPISDTYRTKRTNEIIPEEKMLEATDTNGYDTDHSEAASDIESSEDRKYWDLVYNAYVSKEASSSTSKKTVLESNTNANCKRISNDTEDKAPSTESDPLGDRETDLILHKTEARHYVQIGNNNTGCPVGDIDNKL